MRRMLLAFAAAVFALLTLSMVVSFAFAHGNEPDEHGGEEGLEEFGVEATEKTGRVMLDEAVRENTLRAVLAGSVLLAVLVLATLIVKKKGKKRRPKPLALHLLFWSVVAVVVAITVYVAGSTIYLNVVSETAGPVHWHADFEVWRCGEPLQLVDPEGFSNRVGSAVLHEHGDNRMHIEGVVVDYRDVSIGSFFRSVGGELHKGRLELPTNQGLAAMKDGDRCPDGAGTLQVFVLRAVNGEIVQQKLDSSGYEEYVPSPYGNVPPGDCIIFEFGSEVKDKTARLCESYEAALKTGHVEAGHGAAGDADGG